MFEILKFPDERLRRKAKPVTEFGDKLRAIVNDMLKTMYAAPGIGLSAIQVNLPLQIAVVDVSEERNDPIVLVNPRIVARDGTTLEREGCLSFPGEFAVVERHRMIILNMRNPKGEEVQMRCTNLLAICIQHEIDHLNGKLFIDHLSRQGRRRIERKLKKKGLE